MIKIRTTLIAAIAFLASAAVQAEWVELGRTDAFRIFVERKSIKKEGDTAKILQLMDFTTAQWVDARTVIGSIKHHNEFDCTQMRMRTLAAVAYSEQMTEGKLMADEKVVDPQWVPVEPGSAAEQVRKIACEKK